MARRVSILAVSLLLTWAGSVRAEPGLVVGVTEDGLKFEPEAALADGGKLGVEAFRITLRWRPGLTAPTAAQAAELKRATGSASSVSIVLSVYGERAVYAPTTKDRREAYCAFLAQIVRRYERIRYITIWNEPNKTFFWRPQFNPDGTSAAPGAYEELLARCWDALHEARSDVKVIAPSTAPRGNDNPDAASNVSHSPTAFVRELGRAYRASGRATPIFDVVGHHVHAIDSAERPWRQHPGSGVTQGDLKKLEQAFSEAFAGTSQPFPGHCIDEKCVPVWWLEAGFQTTPDPNKTSLYRGFEISPRPVPDSTGDVELEPLPDSRSPAPDQGTQIVSALRLAYCQPHVEAFFNFLLWDEQRLEGWQSAPYWFDRTPKDSFGAFRSAIREIKRGRVECDSLIAASQTPDSAAKAGSGGSTVPGSTTPNSAQTPAPAAAKDAEGSGEDGPWPWFVAAGGAALLLAAAGLAYLLRRRSGATGGQPRRDSR